MNLDGHSKIRLCKKPHELLVEIDSLKERNKILEQENNFLREQFKLAQSRQFGASSEKSPDQVDWLFNEAEAIADETLAEQENTVAIEDAEAGITSVPAATKKKTGRKPLPADLPRETCIIDVADAEKSALAAMAIYTKSVKKKANNWNTFPPASK